MYISPNTDSEDADKLAVIPRSHDTELMVHILSSSNLCDRQIVLVIEVFSIVSDLI
jgi:hypothetical protein